MSALLNVKQFVRFDEHGNLHVPNKLFVACQAYVQTPLLNDNSSRVATTEWVRAQIVGLTNVPLSETDPIWVFEKALYYTKVQADARYLQSFTETDPTVSAWAKASVKPTYTFAELLSKPTTIAGYGITDIPTTLPASDVYAWAKAATKPSYAYSEITDKPTLFSGSYTDLTNKPTLFSGAYADLTGKPTLFSGSYTDLTNKPTLFSGAYTDLTGKPTIPTNNNELTNGAGYLTSYTETDPIWTAEKSNYALKTYVDTSVSNLVASAPAALNTLNELALALGSDANFSTTVATSIGNRVPYTGATTNVDLGVNDFTSRYVNSHFTFIEGDGTQGGILSFKQYAASYQTTTNHTNIYAISNSKINFSFYQIGGAFKIFNFDVSSLDTTNTRAYTLPNASGTVALTSDIPSLANYVTLNGTQTISGNKTFSGINSFTGYTSFGYASTFMNGTSLNWTSAGSHTAGSLTLSSAHSGSTSSLILSDGDTAKYIYFSFTNTATGIKTYTLPDASGTIALTSNLSSYVPTTRTITINGTAYNLSEDRAWTITTASAYTLPTASTTVLGGIKVGTNLSIDANGVLSSTTYTLAGLGGLPLAGGVMTGAITLKEGAANGLKFPNDAFGGSGDTAGMRLVARTGEDISLEVYVTNDTADWFNIVVPNDSAAKVNGNTIWHAGNLTNNNQLTNGAGYITGVTNISGNAATATTFSTGRGNYKGVTDNAVAGQLMWKNYANNHTIFDASASTSPEGGAVNNTNAASAWIATYPTLMGWNGSGTYGVRVDSARVSDSSEFTTYARYVYDSGLNGGTVGYKEPSALKVNYATDALRSTYAEIGFYLRNYLGNGTANKSMVFYWSGQAGQPTWLWGSNNGEEIYVYNPANFSVNYATTAGSATDATKLPLAGGALTGNLTITGTTNAPLTLRAVEPYMDVVATGGSNTAGVALYPTAGYDAAIGNFNGGSLNLVAAGYTIAKVTRSSGVIFYVGTTGPIQALGNNTSAYHTFVNSASDNKSWDISLYGNDWILNESNVLPRLKVLAGGGVYADSFFEFSDKRFKQVVKDNPDFVGIESITAKHYIKEGKEEIGYFAQDFEGVLDSAILKDKDDVLSLSYRQVHTAKIAALEKRIAELEAKLK